MFTRGERVVLYDLTSTHLEGRSLGIALAKRGHSKHKRSGCPLATLALVVHAQGFPPFSQSYAGHQVEPLTLPDGLARLQEDGAGLFKGGQPTLVMDRGIATKASLALMHKKAAGSVVKAQVVASGTTWVCREWIRVQRAPQIGLKTNAIVATGAGCPRFPRTSRSTEKPFSMASDKVVVWRSSSSSPLRGSKAPMAFRTCNCRR